MKFKRFVVLAAIALVPVALFAHHGSGISYDTDIKKLIAMKGTAKEWVWKNPHWYII